ncbi:hypothetical protein [Blastopirellula retiformator]|nr:hypothetical protein [Blastopirellula retiformator]
MLPALQLAQSVACLGQIAEPISATTQSVAMSPAIVLLLAIAACGFLAVLLTIIFGRWKILAGLLVCGVLGTIGLGLLSLVAVRVDVQTENNSPYRTRSSMRVERTTTRQLATAPPIELRAETSEQPTLPDPASPPANPASQATIVNAVGSALYDAFVQPTVNTAENAGASRIIPPGRPDWVDQEPTSQDGVDYVSLSTGPYSSSTECYKALQALTEEAVLEQTAQLLGSEARASRIPLDDQLIADHIHLQTYKEQLDTTVGPMQQWHAHLQFNDQFRREIEQRWRQVQQSTRLGYAGGLFAGVLAVLGILYSALSYNAATDRRHQGRLQTIAGAAILGVVGGAILLTQWFPPV